MTKDEKTDIKVGITVLLGLAVLLAGIVWAKQWSFGGKAETARAIFATAGGLEPGDPVTINGVKSGTVKAIKVEQADVIVTMAFDKHVDLRKDASASISMLELMSGKKVELVPGQLPERLGDSALIPGEFSGDISSLVATVTKLSATIQAIVGGADTLIGSLNHLMRGDSMSIRINSTLDVAKSTLTTLSGTAERVNRLIAENGPGLKRTVEQADAATRDLSQALQENRPGLRLLIDSGGKAVGEARAALAKANILAIKLDSLISGSGEKGTLFNKLMKDPAFSEKIDEMATSLLKLTEQLRLQGLDANIRFWSSTKADTSRARK